MAGVLPLGRNDVRFYDKHGTDYTTLLLSKRRTLPVGDGLRGVYVYGLYVAHGRSI